MSNPYVGEIRMFGGNFAPVGWALCDGSIMSIAQNDALFNLIGTTYGGDGQSTFAVPDLQGRVPIHQGGGFVIGRAAGVEAVTLQASQMPNHNHAFNASAAASAGTGPGGNVVADSTAAGAKIYVVGQGSTAFSPAAVSTAGASQPHENRMPYLAVSFIISLFGIFPSQG